MEQSELAKLTGSELKRLLDAGEISCADVMKAALDRAREVEPEVQAYLHLKPEAELMEKARQVDERRRRGEAVGPLAGLPVAVKDNISTRDLRTTCASRMLEKYVPTYDATVVELIEQADGIIIGKTNMDEFAMGSSTENSAFQVTKNPHDRARVPGGSSGGSAAAVATGTTVFAIGSDTGGSVRQPASYCGVVGLKPTYGRISRYGLIAYASSLDHIGIFGKSAADAAMLLSVLGRHDPRDSTSLSVPPASYALRENDPVLRSTRVGVAQQFLGEGLDPEVRRCYDDTLRWMAEEGAEVVPIELPHTEYAVPCYYIISSAEASSNLARYDGCKFGYRSEGSNDLNELMALTRAKGFGAEVKRRIILGTYVLSAGYFDAYYLRASKVRTVIRRDYEAAFAKCDVILQPVAPTLPFRIGEKLNDPLQMYLVDIFSVLANLTGLPAVAFPAGWTDKRLPIGLQLVGRMLAEDPLLRVAARLEEVYRSRR